MRVLERLGVVSRLPLYETIWIGLALQCSASSRGLPPFQCGLRASVPTAGPSGVPPSSPSPLSPLVSCFHTTRPAFCEQGCFLCETSFIGRDAPPCRFGLETGPILFCLGWRLGLVAVLNLSFCVYSPSLAKIPMSTLVRCLAACMCSWHVCVCVCARLCLQRY